MQTVKVRRLIALPTKIKVLGFVAVVTNCIAGLWLANSWTWSTLVLFGAGCLAIARILKRSFPPIPYDIPEDLRDCKKTLTTWSTGFSLASLVIFVHATGAAGMPALFKGSGLGASAVLAAIMLSAAVVPYSAYLLRLEKAGCFAKV